MPSFTTFIKSLIVTISKCKNSVGNKYSLLYLLLKKVYISIPYVFFLFIRLSDQLSYCRKLPLIDNHEKNLTRTDELALDCLQMIKNNEEGGLVCVCFSL